MYLRNRAIAIDALEGSKQCRLDLAGNLTPTTSGRFGIGNRGQGEGDRRVSQEEPYGYRSLDLLELKVGGAGPLSRG